MDAGEPYTVRFKVAPGKRVDINDLVRGPVGWDADSTVGDFILLRSSGIPVYNFCVAGEEGGRRRGWEVGGQGSWVYEGWAGAALATRHFFHDQAMADPHCPWSYLI